MRVAVVVVALAGIAVLGLGAPCDELTNPHPTLPTRAEVTACFDSFTTSSSSRDDTLDTLEAAFKHVYSFTDLYLDTGAPWDVTEDILDTIATMRATSYTSDVAFQDDLLALTARLKDPHTVYFRPSCYAALAVVAASLSIDYGASGTPSLRLQRLISDGTDITARYEPNLPVGRVLTHVNNVDAVTAVKSWADAHLFTSLDPSLNFQSAVGEGYYFLRDLASFPVPTGTTVSLRYLDGSGTPQTYTADWLFFPTGSFDTAAELRAACAAPPPDPVDAVTAGFTGPHAHTAARHPVTKWVSMRRQPSHAVAMKPQPSAAGPLPPRGDTALRRAASAWPTAMLGPQHVRMAAADARHRMLQTGWTLRLDRRTTTGIAAYSRDGVVLVTLSTFSPPALTSCGNDDGCVNRGVDSFIRDLKDSVRASRSANAHTLIVDLSGNGGGFVVLGQIAVMVLSQAAYDSPTKASLLKDMRATPFVQELFAYGQTQRSFNDDLYDLLSTLYSVEGEDFIQDVDSGWLDPGRLFTPTNAQHSNVFRVDSPQAIAHGLSTPPCDVPAHSFALVSDGLCGSTCAQFVTSLKGQGLADVSVVYGGLGTAQQSTYVAGGFIVSDVNSIADAYDAAAGRGYTWSSSVTPVPVRFTTSAALGVNWAEAFVVGSDTSAVQFAVDAPDLQLITFPVTNTEYLAMMDQVATYVNDTRGFDTPYECNAGVGLSRAASVWLAAAATTVAAVMVFTL